jgi:uncharacterized protein YjbI with pentapeptide repeats
MPNDNELWIPPQLPKAQKKLDRRHKNVRQIFWRWTGFPEKTLWDWLQLLGALAIPIVIAAGTLWFSAQQSESSSQASEKQHQTDLQIAKDQQEESALQTYLDRMSDLLLNSKLRESQPGDEVRNVARARTLTILAQLDGTRKGEIIRFLDEAGIIDQRNVIISLRDADLRKAYLHKAYLNHADLSYINLNDADLSEADLSYSNLNNTNFSYTNFNYAELWSADLTDSNIRGVSLIYTDLRTANLKGTHATQRQLKQAMSLQGAIMPDGSTHP